MTYGNDPNNGGGERDVLDRATDALRDETVSTVSPALIARTQRKVRDAVAKAPPSFVGPTRAASPFRHPLLRVAAIVALTVAGLAVYAGLRPSRPAPLADGSTGGNDAGAVTGNVPPTLAPAEDGTRPVAPADAGVVRGRVRFAGVAPKPAIMSMAANAHLAAHHHGEVIDESILVNADGSLRNVVVWVSGGLEGRRFEPPSQPAVLDQHGCVFTPHVVTVMAGQRLLVKNSDPFVHNVRAAAANNPPFNFAQPTVDRGKPLVFNGPERMLVKCDIHPWMSAYVHVIGHPFFAVSGADGGEFRLPPDLPPGKYAVTAWHEVFGERRAELVVEAGHLMPPLEFTFNATQRADAEDAGATLGLAGDCCRTVPTGLLAMRP